MRVKLTLRRPAAPLTDIVVMADSTATVADVARQIASTDPTRSIPASPADVLTLSVAPPTSEQLTMLTPDLLVGDAPIGSGFLADRLAVLDGGHQADLRVDDQQRRIVGTAENGHRRHLRVAHSESCAAPRHNGRAPRRKRCR